MTSAVRRYLRSAFHSACVVLAACAPGARPLGGVASRAALPPASLAPSPAVWKFLWTYKDETFTANGDGVLRVAPAAVKVPGRPSAPGDTTVDRARLDFFLKNGMSGGFAVMLGDSLFVPGPDLVKRFLPPPTMLWAALGKLTLPATADTVVRMSGDTLRADLGRLGSGDASKAQGQAWRVAFAGRSLVQVDHIDDGRRIEWMTRRRVESGQWEITYVHETGRRRLVLTVADTTLVKGFDDAIWRRP